MTTRVQLCAALAILVATALATAPARSSPQGKAFPAGCWIGKSSYSGKSAIGPAKGAVSEGTQSLVLWIGSSGVAYGSLIVRGNATGTFEIAGSALAAEMKLRGDYSLTGIASEVEVDGLYSITGTARGTGQLAGTFPIKVKMPITGTLVVKTVSPNRVTGHFRKAPWSTTRRTGTPSKNPKTCLDAA
ncbi:MAG: hypothetical protein ACRDPX_01635 [Gaiellaceae bacterium]